MIIEGIEVEDKATVFLASFFDPNTKAYRKKEMQGLRFKYLGATFYLHRGVVSGWGISEERTGAYVAGGRSRASALATFKNNITQRGLNEKSLAEAIRKAKKVYDETTIPRRTRPGG